MKISTYLQPNTLEELLNILAQYSNYQLLAGGTDLLVRWKRGNIKTGPVINIKTIIGLDFLTTSTEGLKIGSLVTINRLLADTTIQERYPALAQGALSHSSPLIRNLATVVGNICNASPAADLIPPLLVYGAQLEITSKDRVRHIALEEFFTGPGQTRLAPGEIVTSIFIPNPLSNTKSVFLKEGKRKAHEIAVANCAVSYQLDNNHISNLKIALGAVGPTPIFLQDLSWFTELTDANLTQLSDYVENSVSPITDQRSTDWYRRDVIKVLVRRAIKGESSDEVTN